ncbi:MAG: adenosylmethionine--8-amino-7-oxononanoate transaminase [Candidatus Omnitrophica bacterium]|nr:adenosylmethionine--8-amino-7-oxononanoate transaminase [Candidatus Omnitrophota bacterium]MBU1127931.1 adenosylmethionine--8-amino-7-oxononanoate transaminase [Candidatus Omnitrophota bacterium]MBU1851614.1 adenosylmethionine--8-amino-7-oxononanoate transaminase [Candidatus Omnitrophota bacterium]
MDKHDLVSKDLMLNWHPYTQMKDCVDMPPIPLAGAKGVKLYDYDGNFYYDTISSWWCNVHGHGHPAMIRAIKKQLSSLEHTLFAGFTHAPAVGLSERLVDITPAGLKKVFYSDNGSTSVEVAMKMSFQYWKNTGCKGKNKFLSLDRGYHGDTIGAMSVSGIGPFNKVFEQLFLDVYKIPSPYCYRCPVSEDKADCSLGCLHAAESMLNEHSDEIAAMIIEPLLMGAGGMIIYPAEYLKGIAGLCRKYHVHLIVDEVATGFGRTGKMFASEYAAIDPDFMCLSKGITSGYLPLGATLTTEKIYDAFYADYHECKTFYHGHTYTANPVACAAAISCIDLFEKEGTLRNVDRINAKLKVFLNDMAELDVVGETRSIGAVGVLELVKDRKTKEPFGIEERLGLRIYKKGLREGLLLRPLGNIIYFFLPLSTTPGELDDIFARAARALAI